MVGRLLTTFHDEWRGVKGTTILRFDMGRDPHGVKDQWLHTMLPSDSVGVLTAFSTEFPM